MFYASGTPQFIQPHLKCLAVLDRGLCLSKHRSSTQSFYSHQLHVTQINHFTTQMCIFVHRGNSSQNVDLSIRTTVTPLFFETELNLLPADTDTNRQFTPEDIPRASKKMLNVTDNQGKANQCSKRDQTEGDDNNTGLQDCGETGSLLPRSVKHTLVQPSQRTTWQYFIPQTHIPFNPTMPFPNPLQSYSPRCTDRLIKSVLYSTM